MSEPVFGAVEGGGTKFVCAVGSSSAGILYTASVRTSSPSEVFGRIKEFFSSSRSKCGRIAALGIASFGPIELDRRSRGYGALLATPKPGWTGASYPAGLSDLAVPLVIDTDVNAAVLGETIVGAGKDCGKIAYVTVGRGIGVGVTHDGRPLKGISHFELGHIRPPRAAGDSFSGRCPFHGDFGAGDPRSMGGRISARSAPLTTLLILRRNILRISR